METLPLYTEDAHGVSEKPRWATPHPRPSRNTMIWRYFVVVCFLICYYLLLRPTEAPCTSLNCYTPCDTPGCAAPDAPVDRFTPFEPEQSQDENYELDYEQPKTNQRPLATTSDYTQTKVPLEAHIMSKCPDAQDCLQKLVLPAMEQISDKVNFNLSFIASVSSKTSEIECMHGPGECIGDMLMLCAANLPFPPTADESLLPQTYPRTPIIRSLGFANCLINDFSQIPDREFVHQCAMEHGIDFEALNKCASQQGDKLGGGGQGEPSLSGLALLRESALRSQSVGARISCTVRLDESVWCIRDGGEWRDCAQKGDGANPQALIEEVKRLWEERN
ncbi:Gamma interferon inducible lysosomal thiol reductase GILT [Penicillium canariense]|uniref:Gamma interferon inducible lysosomal thiol reductase GILT n=1 Tax=Penicillium canariense TaxID=189055 RepID=A0A9W9HVF5_9EURO|nr:Gamma interferon inducible lysosomal thiol reductase GILT [Penicillium canariense]KAJ5159764.1 Gamma interferon inducible lysosomal thiol reductase GILT [Penicillium canariense]